MKAETKPVKAKILAQKAKETTYKIQDILEIISSFSKILRITCYFLKFLSNTINGITDGNKRKHLEDKYFSKNFLVEPKGQFPGTFNPSQLKCATNFHIREAQAKIFLDEINSLKAKKNINNSSKLSKLNPYLDESGVIRMDSRLEHHHMYPEQMTMRKYLYVDDLILNVDTIEEAILVCKEITDILGGMKMRIRKWASNSCEILDTIPPEDRYPTLNDTNNMISKDTKCLGVSLSPSKDMLHYE